MKLNKRQMQILLLLILILLFYSTWSSFGAEKQTHKEGIIRFHVIANSDSVEDQELKLKVRDGVLEMVNRGLVTETMSRHNPAMPVISGGSAISQQEVEEKEDVAKLSMDETRAYVTANMDEIVKEAKRIIKEEGYSYDAKAKLGICWIPEKTYGETVFPAGNYEALTLTIGDGEGKNWWCVLFPPLCIIDPEGKTLQGISDVDDQIKLKFKTKEIIDNLRK